ncbi:MAG: hypothetical protein MJZ81_11435 [Bacteroidales bacterium]|nr:hypothetical protein [Bacteroidales bacterium]
MKLDEIRDEIVDACERGYLLTDEECGYSLVDPKCVEEERSGIFAARFRLDVKERPFLERMVERVCSSTGSEKMLFVEERMEWGIPYLEIAWVICPAKR